MKLDFIPWVEKIFFFFLFKFLLLLIRVGLGGLFDLVVNARVCMERTRVSYLLLEGVSLGVRYLE